MAVQLISASGTQYPLLVNADGSLNVGGITLGSISISAGSESYVKAGSVIITNLVAGSIVSMPSISVSAGSESWIRAGSVQTYGPVGIGSVRIAEQGVNLIITGSVNQNNDPWRITGSVQPYNPIGIGSVRIDGWGLTTPPAVTGSMTLYGIGSLYGIGVGSVYSYSVQGTTPWAVSGIVNMGSNWGGTGSVYISNAATIGSFANYGTSGLSRTIPTVINGSILVTTGNRIGSAILPTMLNTISWIAISGTNAGSTYSFDVKDSEGFLIQSSLSHTGNWAFSSPIIASGVLVFTISGTQASGTYAYRVGYT